MSNFALIPARGGSKGIPNKNMQMILGKSLIEKCIETAKICGQFDEIIVSSDDSKVLQLAKSFNVLAIKRSAASATDEARASEVVRETLLSSDVSIRENDLIAYLQPTSPFSSKDTITKLINICLLRDLPVFTVKTASDIPSKMLYIDESNVAHTVFPGSDPTGNRQSKGEVFVASGGCYVFKRKHFEQIGDIPVIGALAYKVDPLESVDIDNSFDLRIARLLAIEGL